MAPRIPKLAPEISEPCPPAPLIKDGSLASLIEADAELAFMYARCAEKHRAAVAANELIRVLVSPPSEGDD